MKRRQDQGNKGKGSNFNKNSKGKSNFWSKGQSSNDSKSWEQPQGNKEQGDYGGRGNSRGRRPFGRGRGRSNEPLKCFNCNQLGHHAGRCPKRGNNNNNQGERRTQVVQEERHELDAEEGMVLMMR